MRLPSVKNLSVVGKTVLLRTNYDVPLKKRQRTKNKGQNWEIGDDSRIVESLPTINYLLRQKAKTVIISHLGRPGGKVVPRLSLGPVANYLSKLLSQRVPLIKEKPSPQSVKKFSVVMLENLRFCPGERDNNQKFSQKLAKLADFYVNDAFAVAHRQHASIVGVPRFFSSSHRAFGLDFLEEIRNLAKLRNRPRRPVVIILGGVKKSKLEAIRKLINWADYILIGGEAINFDGVPDMINHHRKILGSLTKRGEDITIETAKKFKKVIARAGTVVWSGPMGLYEEKSFEQGTKEVAQAVAASRAYAVVGGGDTEAALTKFGLVDKIDYISSGGGAMLAFLADGTLSGIEVIRKKR